MHCTFQVLFIYTCSQSVHVLETVIDASIPFCTPLTHNIHAADPCSTRVDHPFPAWSYPYYAILASPTLFFAAFRINFECNLSFYFLPTCSSFSHSTPIPSSRPSCYLQCLLKPLQSWFINKVTYESPVPFDLSSSSTPTTWMESGGVIYKTLQSSSFLYCFLPFILFFISHFLFPSLFPICFFPLAIVISNPPLALSPSHSLILVEYFNIFFRVWSNLLTLFFTSLSSLPCSLLLVS